jgi:hypothetical protein
MTNNQRDKAYQLLADGLDTAVVARRTRLSVPTVRALKANLTMRNQTHFFEVSGTFIVEASSREEAISAVTPSSRRRGARLASSDISASRLNRSSAQELGLIS